MESGRKLFSIVNVDRFRGTGFKVIRRNDGELHYFNIKTDKLHVLPLEGDYELKDAQLEAYILEKLKDYAERLKVEHKQAKELIEKLNKTK